MKKYFLFFLILNISVGALLYPENGSTLNQTHVRFEWEQVPTNAYYILYVSENSDDIENNCIICNQYIENSLIYIDKTNLEWNKTYYWKVISYNDSEIIMDIGSASFSIGEAISETTTNLYNDNNQEGLTIFGSFFDYYSAAIDEQGNEVWNSGNQDLIFYNTDEYGRFFGSEFIGNNAENNYPGIKFSFEDGIIWQEPGDNFIHHDIFQLPNGNYIGLGTSYGEGPIPIGPWTPLFQGLGFEADGETIEFDWMGDKIIEWVLKHRTDPELKCPEHFCTIIYLDPAGEWSEHDHLLPDSDSPPAGLRGLESQARLHATNGTIVQPGSQLADFP